MGCSENKCYSDSSHPTTYNLSWMQNIQDSTKLSEMTIPGTHDSCSLYGICCARTQTWILLEQMNIPLNF